MYGKVLHTFDILFYIHIVGSLSLSLSLSFSLSLSHNTLYSQQTLTVCSDIVTEVVSCLAELSFFERTCRQKS